MKDLGETLYVEKVSYAYIEKVLEKFKISNCAP
jgi:hypothetical protein